MKPKIIGAVTNDLRDIDLAGKIQMASEETEQGEGSIGKQSQENTV